MSTKKYLQEECFVYLSEKMLQTAEQELPLLEKKYRRERAILNARKADCLSRLIKANTRGIVLTPHQVAVAQEHFKRELTRRKRLRAQAFRQTLEKHMSGPGL